MFEKHPIDLNEPINKIYIWGIIILFALMILKLISTECTECKNPNHEHHKEKNNLDLPTE